MPRPADIRLAEQMLQLQRCFQRDNRTAPTRHQRSSTTNLSWHQRRTGMASTVKMMSCHSRCPNLNLTQPYTYTQTETHRRGQHGGDAELVIQPI